MLWKPAWPKGRRLDLLAGETADKRQNATSVDVAGDVKRAGKAVAHRTA